MNFKELQEKIGQQSKADWFQHQNGGGWINKKAKVDKSVFVGENAVVFSGHVYDNARVYGNAQVSGNAWVSGDARIYGNARVYGDARIYGDARVYGDAHIYGDAWDRSPLFIVGSRHSLTNCKKGYIQIGCHCKTIEWWYKNYKAVGKKEGYSEIEMKEYFEYIKLFKKIGK